MKALAKESPKPKMLVLELWGLGDLAIATPFLRAACEKFDVTLLAKPHALELQREFWPDVKVVPFTAPWTPFQNKYRLLSWPWKNLFCLFRELRREKFEIVVSARWDPRDHVVLWLTGAKERWGFPRLNSGIFLSRSFSLPDTAAQRFASWKTIARELELNLQSIQRRKHDAQNPAILIHTGASHPAKVWPLQRFSKLAEYLRSQNYPVRVICDPFQKEEWLRLGETSLSIPSSIPELINELKTGTVFIGNDSGPGHLAALSGVPTFTIFGTQFAEAFLPLHPDADYIEGKPCPYKPCYESCRFSIPHCLNDLTEPEVRAKVEAFVKKHLSNSAQPQTTLPL